MLTKFYWGTVRKAIVAFGNMFNGITLDREDASGTVQTTIRVPLSYAPKQKFLARIDQLSDAAEDRKVGVVLPRMTFELVNIQYDGARKVSLVQQNRKTSHITNTQTTQYVPAPYNLNVNLYVYAKNTDDGLQIIEQILPYFNPDFVLSVKAIPEMDIVHDLPIILNGVEFEDMYEGDFEEKRKIIWTLSFTIKTNFYGPTNKQGVIKKAIVPFYSDKTMVNTFGTYTVTVDPSTAMPGNTFTFVETFEGFE